MSPKSLGFVGRGVVAGQADHEHDRDGHDGDAAAPRMPRCGRSTGPRRRPRRRARRGSAAARAGRPPIRACPGWPSRWRRSGRADGLREAAAAAPAAAAVEAGGVAVAVAAARYAGNRRRESASGRRRRRGRSPRGGDRGRGAHRGDRRRSSRRTGSAGRGARNDGARHGHRRGRLRRAGQLPGRRGHPGRRGRADARVERRRRLLLGGRRRGLQRLRDDAAGGVGLHALGELGGPLGLAAGPLAQALDLTRLGEIQQRHDAQADDRRVAGVGADLLDEVARRGSENRRAHVGAPSIVDR